MNAWRLPILLFFLLTLLAGCGNDAAIEQILDAAEAKMTEHPDSSLSLLSEIDPGQINSDDTRARHALLLSQAKDKNYIDETNDSLINIAVDHYASGDNPYYQFLSLYYQGRVYYNNQNYTKSILSYTQAEQLTDKFDNPHAVGLLYSNIGLIYQKIYDSPKALEAYQKANNLYEKAGSLEHVYYTKHDVANINYTIRRYDEAEKLYLEVIDWANDNSDTLLIQNCVNTLILIYDILDDDTKLNDLYNSEFFLAFDGISFNLLKALAYRSAQEGDSISAYNYLEKAKEAIGSTYDTFDIYYTTYRVNKCLGNYKVALNNYEEVFIIQDSVTRELLQQPLETARRDYYKARADLNDFKYRTKSRELVFAIVIALFLLVTVFLVYRHKVIKREAEIRRYIDDLSILSSRIIENKDIIVNLNQRIDSNEQLIDSYELFATKAQVLFERQFNFINKIIVSCWDVDNKAAKFSSIYPQIKAKVGSFIKDYSAELEVYVNQYMGDIMALLRKETNLKEDDYRLLCLVIAGFSSKAICLLTSAPSDHSINMRKARLCNEIIKVNPPSLELFLAHLKPSKKG